MTHDSKEQRAMTDPARAEGDARPLEVRIQESRYAMFRLLRAGAPHSRLNEEWSKLEKLLDVAAPQSGMRAEGEALTVPYNPCLAKLRQDEPFFVLLGRDKQAPNAIMTWANDRTAAEGKSPWSEEAREIAYKMAAYSGNGAALPAAEATRPEPDAMLALEPFIKAARIIAKRPQDYGDRIVMIGGLSEPADLRKQDFIDLERAYSVPVPPPDGAAEAITTEQLDKLQFGRVLHERPARTASDSASLNESLDMLSEISERARELNIGLAEYPVEDVERVVAVLSAGKVGPALRSAPVPAPVVGVTRETMLEQTIRDSIVSLERNSTSAPVVECLKAALLSPVPDATVSATKSDTRHYLNAIRVRLETLYAASENNPRLREQLSDEVDWIDAQLAVLTAALSDQVVGWRTDLENAPRDTAVWLLFEGNPYLGYCEPANWLRDHDTWFAKATYMRCEGKTDSIYCCHGVDVKPTAWQPLPGPPPEPTGDKT